MARAAEIQRIFGSEVRGIHDQRFGSLYSGDFRRHMVASGSVAALAGDTHHRALGVKCVARCGSSRVTAKALLSTSWRHGPAGCFLKRCGCGTFVPRGDVEVIDFRVITQVTLVELIRIDENVRLLEIAFTHRPTH